MKKTLCLVLAIVLVLGCFAGCGKPQTAGDFEVYSKKELDPKKIGDYGKLKLPFGNGEKIELLIASDVVNLNELIVVTELEKRTGVDLDITVVASSSLSNNINVRIASKKLPHIFNGITAASAADLGKQNAIEKLDENIDIMPNFKEIFYDNTEKYNTTDFANWLKSSDGHIYQFPVWDIQRDVNHGFLYRKDIFDKHGIKMWNTTEEFYETLKKLKELYPDSYPLTSKTKAEIFVDFAGMFNIRSYLTWTPYFDEEEGIWKQSLTDPKMKEIADLLKKLYNEGLMDPEFLTNTTQAWTSKMTNKNLSFITFDWIGKLEQFSTNAQEAVPGYDLRYANPIGTGKVRTLDKVWGGASVAAKENSDKAMMLLDYLLSESGAMLSTMGIEGVTFEFDENGKAKYLGIEDNETLSTGLLSEKYGLFSLTQVRYDKRSIYYNYTEREQEAQDLINNKENGGYNPFDPVLIFTDEELEVKDELQPIIKKAAEEFLIKYVLGNENWDEWIANAEKLGSGKLVDIYNQAYKRNYK